MEPLLHDGMCRCCATEGTFKDFLTAYHWMGEEEIYADMLKDCFSISLITSLEINNGGICEVCITQLRNAVNFRRQVLQTEEQFKKRLEDAMFKTNQAIKLELPHDGDSDNNMSEDYAGNDFELPIKVEKEEKPKKRSAKASTSKAKKSKTDEGEPSAKRNESETSYIEITIKQEPTFDSETEEEPLDTFVEVDPEIDDTKTINKKNYHRKSKKDLALEKAKHLGNISNILLNTNATPIRYHDGASYVCALCPETYPQPSELKQHVLDEHDEMDKSSFMEGQRITSYIVKLDITGLCCLICKNDIESFDYLFVHLSTVHGKEMHTDIPNHIIPFRFVGNMFDCVECPKSFEHFKLVQEHMRVHYQNYVCETCKAPFVNKRALQNHANRHKKGDFPCSVCPKMFDTNRKKMNHEKFVHAGDYKRKKCPFCQEKFTNYAKKRSHMVEEHGAEPLSMKCDICHKVFSTRARLRGHTRREHMECSHSCSYCDMRFYTKIELDKHTIKHTPLKVSYQCDVCHQAYSRKHNLSKHLKKHVNNTKSHSRRKQNIKIP